MSLGAGELDALCALADYLARRRTLDELLEACTVRAAALLGAPRASVQVLDAKRAELVAFYRHGEVSAIESAPFALGEGLAGWIALHERPIRVAVAKDDPRFVVRESDSAPFSSYLGVPLLAGGECLGVLAFSHEAPGVFGERHQTLAVLVAALVAPHVELARLAQLTRIDPLTGLLNRRGLDRLEESGQPEAPVVSLICVDLDHFKRVNDAHGHAVGDRVLVMVADVLAQSVRKGDSVARIGGEEFLVIMPGAPLAAAIRTAELARAAIGAATVEAPDGQVRVTASFGVAEHLRGESHDDTFQRADAALYEAKRLGRDRVVAG